MSVTFIMDDGYVEQIDKPKVESAVRFWMGEHRSTVKTLKERQQKIFEELKIGAK